MSLFSYFSTFSSLKMQNHEKLQTVNRPNFLDRALPGATNFRVDLTFWATGVLQNVKWTYLCADPVYVPTRD